MRPLVLPANVQRRFYRGGARIAELRGLPRNDDHTPEDWVGATNPAFRTDGAGLTRLPDGRLLRDAIEAEPEAFLGGEHLARFGPDPRLLVKLLDAGERLPVHYHPGRAFARAALGSEVGKTEAWLIVSADPGAEVRLGFHSEVDTGSVRTWIEEQNVDAMMASLHRLPVARGDVLLVPAGTPHVIGEGILLVELQEPSDFSVLLEMAAFGLSQEDGADLGLGWARVLEALDTSAWDERRLAAVRGRPRAANGRSGASALLPADADPYFRAELLQPEPRAELDPGFSILVVLEGKGTLAAEDGAELPLTRGETVLVPYAAGSCTLDGELEAVRCRPPDPAAGEGEW